MPQRNPGRERDLGALDRQHRLQYQLVEAAAEVPAPVEEALGDGELLVELRRVRRAHLADQRLHRRVGGQQVREHRQQPVAEVGDAAGPHVEVEHAEKLPVRAAVGDDRAAAGVLHDHRPGNRVVRVAAEHGVDAAHARSELEVDVHAVVREEDDDLRALRARGLDVLLERLLLDAEGPLRHEVARVGDRRVGERLADDRHRDAVDLVRDPRREHRVAEVLGLDVLRDELDPAGELLRHGLLHALGAVGEFPVRGHHVDAERELRGDHVRAPRPQREARALPGVAAVEEQRARPLGADPLDQRREVRVTADPAVGACGALEVEVGEGVGFARAGRDPERLQQVLAHEVRRPSRRRADADVHARLPEPGRTELGVRVGDVQQRDVAEPRHAVERIAARLCECLGRVEREPGGGAGGEDFEELSAVHRAGAAASRGYLLTGEPGSSSNATRSLICCSLSAPPWPKRGICEQRLYALAL